MTATAIQLQRITTAYDPVQDRIRLAGETAQAHTVALWLTQRLLAQLLPHLTTWLERHHGGDDLRADLLNQFAQQAALNALEPQAPVQASPTAHGPDDGLVVSVDITTSADGVALTFKGVHAPMGRLNLQAMALRQWLGIVHLQCVQAGWPTDHWPEWMQPPEPPAQQRALMH